MSEYIEESNRISDYTYNNYIMNPGSPATEDTKAVLTAMDALRRAVLAQAEAINNQTLMTFLVEGGGDETLLAQVLTSLGVEFGEEEEHEASPDAVE